MDASIVHELVGHEHSNTTDKYHNQISIERMKVELEKFEIPKPKNDLTAKNPLIKIISSHA
jgi:hypothetical protein